MKKDNKQLFLNMFSSILAFAINTGIQFVITPILSKKVGDGAYGFITIANDFTSYASVFAVILNSVASRFISVEIHKGNNDKAEEYYNSIFVGNIVISTILAILGIIIVFRFDTFLDITPDLVGDVSILFLITFGNYILSVMISLFTVSVYVKNRLELASIRNIISYFIRLFVVIILFSFAIHIKVYFLAIASFISTIFLGIANAKISKKIMPEIRIKPHTFRIGLIIEILKTGVWMTINNLSNVLANNFTTIIINQNIGSDVAGFYSVARTIPNAANSFVYAIYSVFVPTYYKLYAEEKKDELISYSITSMKIMAYIISVPVMVLCIKSKEFLSLWQSYRSENEIAEMSHIFTISLALCICYSSVLTISQLGLVTNNIKIQMINNIFISCSTLFGTFIAVKYLNNKLVCVALASLVIQGGKWLFFTPIYAAYVIKAPRFTFFKENIKIVFLEIIVLVILLLLGKLLTCNSWPKLILVALFLSVIGYSVLFILLLNREEKKFVIKSIKGFLIRR